MGIFSSTELKTLKCLFKVQLKDIYDAEHRIVEALPKMADAADSPQLAAAFRSHLKETKQQIDRLKLVFEFFEETPERKACAAMKGLISEADEMVNATGSAEVRDAALICYAQRIEHYEMAVYGCLRTLATRLGETEASQLLKETLHEEGAADHWLTEIAESSVNDQAARA